MPQHGPGRELDALVQSKVMPAWDESRCRVCGWPLEPWDGKTEIPTGCVAESCSQRPPPQVRADAPGHYSTDIAAAWEVLEKMRTQLPGKEIMLYWCDGWGVGSLCQAPSTISIWDSLGEAETAPHAICLAALKAAQDTEKVT